jgi:hypothetical protein
MWFADDAKLRFVIEEEVPRYITTDRNRLYQLIYNLMRHTLLLSSSQAATAKQTQQGGEEMILTLSGEAAENSLAAGRRVWFERRLRRAAHPSSQQNYGYPS